MPPHGGSCDVRRTFDFRRRGEARRPRTLAVEENGINVIDETERKGTPQSLFWPWCAANISVLGISYGSFLLGFGVSLWQATIAAVVGIVASFLLCGFVALAGRPVGHRGNRGRLGAGRQRDGCALADWEGYLMGLFGGVDGAWADANLEIQFALLIGFVGWFLVGHRTVRRQESVGSTAVEAAPEAP